MSGQIQELLVEVSAQLGGVERELARLSADVKEGKDQLQKLRVQLARIEQDEKWQGEERRKVDGRLQTGDHTFQKLQRQIDEARRIAEFCREKLEKETSKGRKLWLKLLERAEPVIVALILQVLYHVFMAGPQIAAAIKKAGGGP